VLSICEVLLKILVTHLGDGTMDLKELFQVSCHWDTFLCVGGKYLFAISIFLPKEVVTSRILPETFTVVSDNDLPLQQQLRCVETRFLFYL
jgi:hypothetical protein